MAKVHFPGNETKNPIESASSWQPFLTLSNQVTQRLGECQGPSPHPSHDQRACCPPPQSTQRHLSPWLGMPATPEGRNMSDTWHSLFQQTTAERFPNPDTHYFKDQEAGAFPGQKRKRNSPPSLLRPPKGHTANQRLLGKAGLKCEIWENLRAGHYPSQG